MNDYIEALKVINAIKYDIKREKVWLLQRWAGWKPNESCIAGLEAVYETLPNYRPMTYDEMLIAQREMSKKYPGQEFRGYRLGSRVLG